MKNANFTIGHMTRVVCAIGWADFMLKYRGSVLGYLWSFSVPLVKFIVIFNVFRFFTGNIPHYPLYLLLGLIIWEHFAITTSACMTVLHDKAPIIKKIVFPRILLTLAVGFTNAVVFATYLAVFLVFALTMGPGLSVHALWFIPLLFVQMTFLALGIGMLISSISLRFRDMQHLWSVALQILFWLTPIMYAYPAAAAYLRTGDSGSLFMTNLIEQFIRFQPLSVMMDHARRVLLYSQGGELPSLPFVLLLTLGCTLCFIVGAWVFHRRSIYFLEEY